MYDLSSFQVGAGVSGLCLALTLLQNGLTVRIIDKEPTPKVGCKGLGVQVMVVRLTFEDTLLTKPQSFRRVL
jgi:flavin-dependent dehydrogenase